ncbi:hypothetical protein GMMP15_860021 [Candidatus Magnetomoraceae bacterium gMMP-15]
MMKYTGYLGHVKFDDEADIFHGEVINIRDVITFQGKSVDKIRQAFEDSIEDYLDLCAERGEEPNRPSFGIDNVVFKHVHLQVNQRNGNFIIISVEDWEKTIEILYVFQNTSLMQQIKESAESHRNRSGYQPTEEIYNF